MSLIRLTENAEPSTPPLGKVYIWFDTTDNIFKFKDESGIPLPLIGNGILNGTVNPTTEGNNGDFYLNTSTNFIFGPKAGGVWPSGVSLVGPTGATGAAGTNGNTVLNGAVNPTTEGVNGDFYINTASNTLFGPKSAGVWPSGISLIGPTGATGAAGQGVPTGGTTGQVLSKIDNTDYNTQWIAAPGGAVDSVNTQTGVVVLDSDDIGEGTTNLYFTDARAKSAAVADSIADSVTDVAPSQNAVFDALALKQDAISGSFNSVAGFDGSGDIQSIPGFLINTTTGGEQISLTRVVGDAESSSIHSSELNLNADENAPTTTTTLFSSTLRIDTNDDGFDLGGPSNTSARVFSNFIEHLGSSDIGQIEFFNNSFTLGDGLAPIDVRGFGYMFGFGTVSANVNITGGLQGYGFQPNIDAAATMDSNSFVQAFYDAANIDCSLGANYTSFNATPNLVEVPSGTNYTGFACAANIDDVAATGGVMGLSVYPVVGDMGANSYLNCVNINPTVTSARYASGINISMDNVTVYAGVSSTLTEQDLTFTWILPGDNNITTLEYTSGATAGSEIVSISGNDVTVQIEDGVSTAQQIKDALEANFGFNSLVNITVTGTASNPQNIFGPENFTGGVSPGSKQAAYFDGDVQITGALSFGGALSIGNLNAFAALTMSNGGGNPQSVHSLISQPNIGNNITVANADTFGINTAALITIGDNSDVTTAFVGVSALGLPAVLTMGSGSTLDRCSGAIFAISLDAAAGGGTVNEVALCRALALPNGVTTVNRLYGYEFNLPFGDPGTDTWGIFCGPDTHNYMRGDLRIGGTTGSDDKVTNSSLAFEIVGAKAMRLPVLTTTERNALTALEGMVIFNTTTSAMEVYDGATWV